MDVFQLANILQPYFKYLNYLANWQQDIILLAIFALAMYLFIKGTDWIILPSIEKLIKLSPTQLDDVLFKRYLLPILQLGFPALLFLAFASLFQVLPQALFVRGGKVLFVIAIVIIILRAIDDAIKVIKRLGTSDNLHLGGIAQAIKLIVWLLGIIFIIAIVIDRTPWTLLGGLGAVTAVVILVFRDVLLGLVAGIQISANNMIKIGDWVEVPELGVDGSVIDITLTTVKIENWDKSVTFLPAYFLISQSFKNWRTMEELGVRRIKRELFINLSSIHLLTPEKIKTYRNHPFLKAFFLSLEKAEDSFLDEVEAVSDPFNPQMPAAKTTYASTRRIKTNAGLFRMYARQYLLTHPQIRNDLTIVARMRPPSAKGMGLELYCFANTANLLAYETIQSSIFEHLVASANLFDLHIFQDPSGLDMRKHYQR